MTRRKYDALAVPLTEMPSDHSGEPGYGLEAAVLVSGDGLSRAKGTRAPLPDWRNRQRSVNGFFAKNRHFAARRQAIYRKRIAAVVQ
jgi:hypothetical protein